MEGEVDRHKARCVPEKGIEQAALIGECLAQVERNIDFRDAVAKRIRCRMPPLGPVACVQRGLRDHHRPLGMPLADRSQQVEDRCLRGIVDPHDGQHEMRLAFAPGQVLGCVIAGLF